MLTQYNYNNFYATDSIFSISVYGECTYIHTNYSIAFTCCFPVAFKLFILHAYSIIMVNIILYAQKVRDNYIIMNF